MNIYWLLSRLLAILYAGFFMLFAFAEGITQYGATHLPAPVLVVATVILLWKRPGWSALVFGLFFLASVWFYETFNKLTLFLIISLPLAIIAVLNLVACRKTNGHTPTTIKTSL